MNWMRSISFVSGTVVAALLCAWPAPASAGPGGLDPTFGANGIVAIEERGTNGEALAIQPDGKIVVVGTAGGKMTVYRFTAGGSLDTSFGGGDGVLPVTGFLNGADESSDGHAVLVQPDGKIVVAGEARLRTEVDSDVAVARLNPDGSLDATFGGDGLVLIDFSTVDWGNALARQPDGKIVVAGQAREHLDDQFGVARLRTDGALDSEFDGDGRVILDLTGTSERGADFAKAVVLQPDGKIVVAGTCGDYAPGTDQYDFCVARLNTNGGRDASFGGGDGFVTVDFFGRGDWGETVALQPDGKIVVGGQASTSIDTDDFGIARLTMAGVLDPTFDGDGRVTVNFPAGAKNEWLNDLLVDPAGRIVAVGSTFTAPTSGYDFIGDVGLVRLLANGAPDGTFGAGGLVTTEVFGFLDWGYAVALQHDGKIVVAGQARRSNSSSGDDSLMVARYLSDTPGPARSALFLPMVMKMPAARPQLTNGDFEAGRGGGWREYSTQGLPLVVQGFAPMTITPHGGAWGAWLAGTHNEVSYIEQTVEIPAGRTTLAYWHYILSEDRCGGDRGGVAVDGTVVDSYNLCESENTDGWELQQVDLRAYAGRIVRLQIRGETDGNNLSHLLVDDVALIAGMTAADALVTPKPTD